MVSKIYIFGMLMNYRISSCKKEPDAFGQTGNEIVVWCPIPWGHFKVGAKKFWALVYMWSRLPPSFSNNGAVILEIFVFFCWWISTYSTGALINITGFLVSLGNWFLITNFRIIKLHSYYPPFMWIFELYTIQSMLKSENKNLEEMCPCIIAAPDTVLSLVPVGRLNIDH